MTEEQNHEENDNIRFHVPKDLDYVYRDVFNVYVGQGDVVIELGNRHRSMPEHVTIANRIVLSVPNAYSLAEQLQQTLQTAQQRLQQGLKERRQE